MLNETFPILKLLLRTTGDIEPHLLKRGSGWSPGDPNCPALRGLSTSISRGTGPEQPGRECFFGQGCQGAICEKEEITPSTRASRELYGEADPGPGSLLIMHTCCCVTRKPKEEMLPGATGWQHEGEGSSGRVLHLQSLGGQNAECFCIRNRY